MYPLPTVVNGGAHLPGGGSVTGQGVGVVGIRGSCTNGFDLLGPRISF